MSRIGKNPVILPNGVQATLSGRTLTVKGPKGVQSMEVHPDIKCEVKGNEIVFTRSSDVAAERALHGTARRHGQHQCADERPVRRRSPCSCRLGGAGRRCRHPQAQARC